MLTHLPTRTSIEQARHVSHLFCCILYSLHVDIKMVKSTMRSVMFHWNNLYVSCSMSYKPLKLQRTCTLHSVKLSILLYRGTIHNKPHHHTVSSQSFMKTPVNRTRSIIHLLNLTALRLLVPMLPGVSRVWPTIISSPFFV